MESDAQGLAYDLVVELTDAKHWPDYDRGLAERLVNLIDARIKAAFAERTK